jgi:uncharacterized membrane protein
MSRLGRRNVISLVLISLAGGVLRFWHIGAQSLWLDELFSVFLARRDVAAVVAGTFQDTQPPLYYLLLHAALLFGSDETAARVVSALFSTATIPLVFLLGRRLFDRSDTALLAAFVFAVTPFQVAYAQEARMYSMLAFLQLAGLFFFHRAWNGGAWSDWLLFAFAEALALYTHSLGILGLVAIDLWVVWQWRSARSRALELLAAHALMLLLFAPWLTAFSTQANRVLTGFWEAPSSLLNLLRTTYVLVFGNTLPTDLVPIGLLIIFLLFALELYHAGRALLREKLDPLERQGLGLALAITFGPPVALFLVSLVRPIYIERVVILSSSGIALLLAWAWTRRPRLPERVLASAAAVLVAVALSNYNLHPEVIKPPMREAAALLGQNWAEGDLVVHASDWTALAFNYYLPAVPQHFLAGDPAYQNPTTRGNSGRIAGLVPQDDGQLAPGQGRLWLVVALEHSEEYQQRRVAEFNERFGQPKELEVGGVYLLSYSFAGVGQLHQ